MQEQAASLSRCPFSTDGADERKSARLASDGGAARDAVAVTGYDEGRAILRDATARQAGFMADVVERFGMRMRKPVLFLSGEAHRHQRRATARFFAPKVVTTRYRALITREVDGLIEALRESGTARLDDMALLLAVRVASEIVGLTDSDSRDMARRLDALAAGGPVRGGRLGAIIDMARRQWRVERFFRKDVVPAIAARRANPREDVISHLIAEGYSDREILTECVTYGAAGMITTREFITMAGWHMFDRPELMARFLAADDAEKIMLLEEILRLEPVVGQIYRRVPGQDGRIAIDVRAANGDAAAFGACPHSIDPDRTLAPRVNPAGLAFGDGEHRCPGAQVAMHETAIFLDALLRLPEIRLTRAPRLGWNALVTGYELRDAELRCATGQAAETGAPVAMR